MRPRDQFAGRRGGERLLSCVAPCVSGASPGCAGFCTSEARSVSPKRRKTLACDLDKRGAFSAFLSFRVSVDGAMFVNSEGHAYLIVCLWTTNVYFIN